MLIAFSFKKWDKPELGLKGKHNKIWYDITMGDVIQPMIKYGFPETIIR